MFVDAATTAVSMLMGLALAPICENAASLFRGPRGWRQLSLPGCDGVDLRIPGVEVKLTICDSDV